MFLTQGQVEAGYFTNNRYGTAGTTTQTTLASSGGLLINIDSATGDIARTTVGWIEDEKYGAYVVPSAATFSAEFDSSSPMTGRLKASLSVTVNVAGFPNITSSPSTAGATWDVAEMYKYGIPVKASTKYRFKVKIQGTVTGGSGFSVSYATFTTAGNRVTDYPNIYSGTLDQWSITEFTTGGTAAFLRYGFFFLAGTTGTMNMDYNSMTLEEVVEPVANSLTSSSPSLVSFTAVGSTDNIDQSFTTAPDSNIPVGESGGLQYINSQSFTATKSKLTGVYLYKRANIGTPTGNIKVDIRTDSAGNPSSTVLATYTIPLATYNALTTNAEFIVNLPCNLTASTKYHIVITNTATESAGNTFAMGKIGAGGYTGGDARFSTNGGSSWTINGTADLYFKTLYYKPTTNFKASQNNQSVSISADEDGFLNGSVYNLSTGTATFTETFGTFYLLQYTISGSDLIAEVNLPGVGLSASSTSDRTLEYSSDGVTYGASFPTGYSKVWVKILAYSGFASFSYSIQFSTASINTLRNYPTNKDIIKQYSTTLGSATTSATYRATKWGFPAIEYSATEYQFLDVDTTATGSTVAFSELGSSYTTVADGASLTITSTSTPNIFVKTNITANRLYLSSNDLNASSDKDGSMKQSCTYQVIQ